VRIRFTDSEIITLHSNDIRLDEPETPLQKMVSKHIDVIYRPWEEKEENLKYKEDKKKADKDLQPMDEGLFAITPSVEETSVSPDEVAEKDA
jgi:hypothetical protein